MSGDRLIIRFLVLVISIPITRILQKSARRLWSLARPRPVAGQKRATSTKIVDVVSYAAIAALASVASQILTRKAAAKSYEKLMGTPPPPEEVAW
jgi:hypothetical protein